MKVAIIGGGIGGLTTAIALQKKGIEVKVFEQAEVLKVVGAGITLANNAMQIMQHLGLKNEIEQQGIVFDTVQLTKADFSLLSQQNLGYFEQLYGVQNIAIHRGALQQILVSQLQPDSLILGHQLRGVVQHPSHCVLEFENGKQYTSDIVVGADGIHSRLRTQLFPDSSTRGANQLCWRGLTNFELPDNFRHKLTEAWGGVFRFGFIEIAPEKVYWYAVKNIENDLDFQNTKLNIADFYTFHPLVRQLIDATATENIHTATINDLKPLANWYKNRICLLGDAAHATTPNMGQGACQAIEDAYVLAACLSRSSVEQAFQDYQQIRAPKVQMVVSTSWTIGKMAHLKNPILKGLCNQMMRFMPESVSRKQAAKLFKLDAF